ncbi:MAG TPA: hypothetical protein VN688_29505 [Gemmataceae bacterium]|nr:hypothetical protein [Gemmataceae bacterium]
MVRQRMRIVLLAGSLIGMALPASLLAADLQAGVAVVDITPLKGYRMAGYFRERPNPAREYAGIDDQLDRAIQEIFAALKTKGKTIPLVPPYPKK